MQIKTKFDGFSRDGVRRYYKGGGGDPGAEARQQEADRQARIRAATEQINRVFNESGRDSLYADQKSTVYDLNKMEVDRQAQEAERMNRFGLARTGLMGGSVAIDSNADLNRRTNEGLLRAGGIADQSAADLKAADERTRSNLLSMAQSGIDTGSAATMALQGLNSNAQSVAGQRSGATIGGLFNDMSQAYLMNQMNAGRGAANTNPYQTQSFGSLNPRQSYGGS